MGIIIPGAKSGELRVLIQNTTNICERLETWVGVADDIAKLVKIHPLRNRTIRRVHHQSHRTKVITDNSISHSPLNHVVGNVAAGGVDEPGHHRARAVQLGDRIQRPIIVVQPPVQ